MAEGFGATGQSESGCADRPGASIASGGEHRMHQCPEGMTVVGWIPQLGVRGYALFEEARVELEVLLSKSSLCYFWHTWYE